MLHENSRECSIGFDYDAIDEKENPKAPHRAAETLAHSHGDQMEFARWLIRFIRKKDRCRLTVDCLYLALGDADLEAITMTSVAAKRGLTKAAISKRVREIREQLHLPINANNKSQDARHRYTETNRSPLSLR